MRSFFSRYFRFLPAHSLRSAFLASLFFVGILIMGMRITEVWTAISTGKIFHSVTPSLAASEKELPKVDTPSLSSQQAENQAIAAKDEQNGKTQTSSPSISIQPEIKNLPTENKVSEDASSAEMSLIKQLTQRRDQLEKREQELDAREAMIKVAEQRIDQKIKEMETLRAQLQNMVSQIDSTQQAQIENLVKIYETMKPKEAARIFEELELPVLLGVVQKMKPQRTAAIMAEMKPEKAKELTVALTKKDQLPQIK